VDIDANVAADASPQFPTAADALLVAMREACIPGGALGILADGREEHATLGLASLASERPVMPETVFQIASVTKTYTATAIWRLIEQGGACPGRSGTAVSA
jgi:CubicO group peptidase (beta-lactamase class C family)